MRVNCTMIHPNRYAVPEYLDQQTVVWRITDVLGDSARALFHTLCNELAWQQPTIRLYGRSHPVPRLTCWLGEKGVRYRYSGIDHCAVGWPTALASLRARLTELTGWQPNGVLANLYRNGQDSMGWHRDNEPELGPLPWVASYSLGATRDFAFRYRGCTRQARVLSLQHDELLIMSPEVQRDFEHALPRRRREAAARLNLTFRQVMGS